MFLTHVPSGDLVEVVDLPDVINPYSATIRARPHRGEMIQRSENFLKTEGRSFTAAFLWFESVRDFPS
jgi:hypothetical protein